jgi:tRNA(Ile)-lysidine synthase
MSLINAVRTFCLQQGLEKTYWLAYSGGLDSHVLLAIFHEVKQTLPLKLHVIHINHGLSKHAKAWEAHCEGVCAAYQINYASRSLQLQVPKGESLEEVARIKRYAVFADCLAEGDVLITAHHQDDQAETILLQLLRGAGPKGLAAMPAIKPFARGSHARPLLSFSRAVLEEYAKTHGLQWIEDESNQVTSLTRNFIRHDILAPLKTRWPNVTVTLARSAAHCAEAQALLEEYVVTDWKKVSGSKQNTLSVQKLLELSPARQRLILRGWIEQQGFLLPEAKTLNAILEDVLYAAWDRMPKIHWQGAELRRYRDDLFLFTTMQPVSATELLEWQLAKPMVLSSRGTLSAKLSLGKGLSPKLNEVCVQFRRGGELVKFAKRGSRSLKNLFQEWGVLPWERERIPLLFVGEELVAVVGHYIREEYQAGVDEMGWEVCFEAPSGIL